MKSSFGQLKSKSTQSNSFLELVERKIERKLMYHHNHVLSTMKPIREVSSSLSGLHRRVFYKGNKGRYVAGRIRYNRRKRKQ